MSQYAMAVDGALRLVTPRPVTADGVQHGASIFELWPDGDLAALGVWRVDSDPNPSGVMITGFALEPNGLRVRKRWLTAPLPPQPVHITPEQLAAFLVPPATPGGGLVLGRHYPAGTHVVVAGETYDVTQPFTYLDAGWTVTSLAAHLTKRVVARSPWVQPTGAHDAYAAGIEVIHKGRIWLNTHGAGNIWEPGVFGWADQGAA
jgi:hypothetical protein